MTKDKPRFFSGLFARTKAYVQPDWLNRSTDAIPLGK
jgi:hypothetical protein